VRYIPNSPSERAEMLAAMGVDSIDSLFRIPHELKLKEPLNLPPAHSEMDALKYFQRLASQNAARGTANYKPSFLGAGAYDHFIPVVIDTLISRAEFYTSYTPYQPEISQGTLQAIFEFQTMICELTGMDVANASLYDGSTAAAEAVLMAARVTGRGKVAIAGNLHPEYREVVNTYNHSAGLAAHTLEVDAQAGTVALASLDGLNEEFAAVVVQSPNFFGGVEELSALADAAHKVGALFVVVVAEGLSLGLLKSPGACGADIVCGEAQSFGIPVSFGGSYCGFFATREKLQRQLPGRLVGEAHDKQGRKGYVLTLATREQHIRREKATSNICTNQGLYALMATVYLSLLGRRGVREVAEQNVQKAHYAAKKIAALDGYGLRYSAPFFNEFVVACPQPARVVVDRLIDKGFVAGLPLARFFAGAENDLLVCVTENVTRAEINSLVKSLAEI
jgi:glycine dehydrogenase subunit 1